MASNHLGQKGDCFNDSHVEKSLPPVLNGFEEVDISQRIPSYSNNASQEVGDPEILPRIGEEYQVDLPPIPGDSSHSREYTDSETRGDDPHDKFHVGLPLLLTWISSERSDDSKKSRKESRNLSNVEILNRCSGPGYILTPGLPDVNWSAIEKDSFLLGLYIFEKNFVEVRRFVETKEMGALLSFYYGKFYGSQEYRRWSECRKMKSKKRIYGRRLFSGLRQQELLSRILRRVSEECQSALLEVSKTFSDEKMSLADYVSSLKTMVGMKILVEAIGIGKGKQDLTAMALEPPKSTQVVPIRPEIPTGKACSSLTTSEIIKFLSGDYRLSKARSNDLFWEAVWPRLLARGWHSEQPKNYFAGSKNFLVFIMPGIKKFSRKLMKGDHYFDSVTDVLSRVAQEPELIVLENEDDDNGSKKEEFERKSEIKSEQNDVDLPTRERRSYLQPRTPKCSNTIVLKFTVVDTSRLCGGKVRGLRSLPSEISSVVIAEDHIEDSDEDNTEETDSIDTMMLDTENVSQKRAKSEDKILHGTSALYQETRKVYPDPKIKKDSKGKSQSGKVSSRKLKLKNMDYVGPVPKRCRVLIEMNASLHSSSSAPVLENGTSSCCSSINEVTENLSSQVGFSCTSSSKGESSHQTQLLIDLNLPQAFPDDSEYGGCSNESGKVQEDKQEDKQEDNLLPESSSATEARTEEQLNPNTRRYSTRNSTPTLRTLQAVAHGYLTVVNRRRKGKETSSNEDLPVRPSQRARGGVGPLPNESASSSVASLQMEEGENGGSTSGNGEDNSEVPPKGNDESGSGQ